MPSRSTLLLALFLTSCSTATMTDSSSLQPPEHLRTATFAGGCFWCTEHSFEELKGKGVYSVVSGYSGGEEINPTYEQVSGGGTGHRETIQVTYDPTIISYGELLDVFWRLIDPTDDGGQFADRGRQYTSAIFFHDEEQWRIAEEAKVALSASGRYDKPIVTAILPFSTFYPAEEYHQNYAQRNPLKYDTYRSRSGRDEYLGEKWEEPNGGNEETVKPSATELRSQLTPLQWEVIQEGGTEPPFDNAYWDNEEEGIYVDIVSGEPLFSSKDKYDSGTGWPSFSKPIAPESIEEREDQKLFTTRTEVRSKNGDAHLGHVFPDGPDPTGLRYCMNSAALRFIPRAELEKEGYGEYESHFRE